MLKRIDANLILKEGVGKGSYICMKHALREVEQNLVNSGDHIGSIVTRSIIVNGLAMVH